MKLVFNNVTSAGKNRTVPTPVAEFSQSRVWVQMEELGLRLAGSLSARPLQRLIPVSHTMKKRTKRSGKAGRNSDFARASNGRRRNGTPSPHTCCIPLPSEQSCHGH